MTRSLGAIRVDPVHLAVSIRNIRLAQRSRPIGAVRRLFISFKPLALLAGTYHSSALELDAPHLDGRIGEDGEMNLVALGSNASPTPSGAPAQIRIDDLSIERGALRFSDHRRSPTAREPLSPVTFPLVHFRTWTHGGGPFALQADRIAARLGDTAPR